METPVTPATRLPHQLSLPFQDQETAAAALPPLPPPLLPQQVWPSLSPTTRAQVRATLLRILQEIPYDAPPTREDHQPSP
jgi:hypothetical protein